MNPARPYICRLIIFKVTWNLAGVIMSPGVTTDLGDGLSGTTVLTKKWPVLCRHEQAAVWLQIWTDLGRAPGTIDAYARGLAEYLLMCEREDVDPVTVNRAHVAVFVRELTSRPHRRGGNVVSIESGSGLANATIQQRLVPVRLFYDFLIEEGVRQSNPVGRGRYTPGGRGGGHQRGLVPQLAKLPWIPGEQQWLRVLEVARRETVRNRVMLALAYDAALRREELCSLRTEDLDPAHRTLRVRAETTKNRLERVVPYSASTGVLLSGYLAHRAGTPGRDPEHTQLSRPAWRLAQPGPSTSQSQSRRPNAGRPARRGPAHSPGRRPAPTADGGRTATWCGRTRPRLAGLR